MLNPQILEANFPATTNKAHFEFHKITNAFVTQAKSILKLTNFTEVARRRS